MLRLIYYGKATSYEKEMKDAWRLLGKKLQGLSPAYASDRAPIKITND